MDVALASATEERRGEGQRNALKAGGRAARALLVVVLKVGSDPSDGGGDSGRDGHDGEEDGKVLDARLRADTQKGKGSVSFLAFWKRGTGEEIAHVGGGHEDDVSDGREGGPEHPEKEGITQQGQRRSTRPVEEIKGDTHMKYPRFWILSA